MSADILERGIYGMSQVDRLLELPAGTARRWIDGYERAGKRYASVIREDSTGDEIVTWGEFIEAGLLAAYRDKGVPLRRMRPAIELLREQTGIRYPLAHFRPLVGSKELVLRVQSEVGLEKALWLVVVRNQQLVLAPESDAFVDKLEFVNDGPVIRMRPAGPASPVVVDPLRAFGMPVVRSVRTEVIAEEFRAGDSLQSIAAGFELEVDDVTAALRFEMQQAQTAA